MASCLKDDTEIVGGIWSEIPRSLSVKTPADYSSDVSSMGLE